MNHAKQLRSQSSPEFRSFYFNPSVAEQYDRERSKTVKQQIVRSLEKEFFTTNVSPRDSVLEIGAGTGEITAALAHCAHVTALDVSPTMLEQARRKVTATNVEFRELDMFQLDSLGGMFDAVVASRVFLHLEAPDLVRMLMLVHDRLISGGQLIFDIQRPSVFRLALAQFEKHKVANPCYTRSRLLQALDAVPGLKLEKLIAFDHWPILLPLAFVPGAKAPTRLHRLALTAEEMLENTALGASRWGIVCRRR